jgi:hypothetical protein
MRTRIFRPAPISRLGRMICSYPLRCVALGRADLPCAPGSGRTETHDSVRVEFESPRGCVRLALTQQHGFKSPTGCHRRWHNRSALKFMGLRVPTLTDTDQITSSSPLEAPGCR